MAEAPATYQVRPPGPVPGEPPQIIVAPGPLDPRTRLLVVGIRAALLALADALGAYAGLPKRE